MFTRFAFISALLALTYAAPVNSSGKTVHIPLHKEPLKYPAKNFTVGSDKKLNRRNTPDQPFTYNGIRYLANYEVGGQSVEALLDTGSSDTFVFSSEVGSNGYTPGQSPDYKWQNNDFQAAYGDGSNRITGTWFLDDVTLGGATIKEYNVALLNQSSTNFPGNIGILAVGPEASEVANPHYPPLYQRFKSDGLTDSASYSLFTSDSQGTEASLIFGGIDTAKFDGPLNAIPFATTEITGNSYFSVDWQYQGVWYENGVLDTGTAFILINSDIASNIANEYGASWDDAEGAYIGTSSPDLSKPPLPITVGGVTINVPVEYLWLPLDGINVFGVQPNQSELGGLVAINILGDPFLRSVYSFYDIDNETYYFAPIKVTDDSDIVGVSGQVPNSQTAPDPTEGHTGNGNPGGFF